MTLSYVELFPEESRLTAVDPKSAPEVTSAPDLGKARKAPMPEGTRIRRGAMPKGVKMPEGIRMPSNDAPGCILVIFGVRGK